MSIQDDVIKLYKSGAKRIVLDELRPRPAIAATVGVGAAPAKAAATSSATLVRKQVITVYSHLIITADGAFERPHGWPVDGAYPSETPIPSQLPDSLINTAGTLALDIDVQYYEQKRVHLVVYEIGEQITEDWFLVQLAAPYEGTAQYLGLDKSGGLWSADLQEEHSTQTMLAASTERLNQINAAI